MVGFRHLNSFIIPFTANMLFRCSDKNEQSKVWQHFRFGKKGSSLKSNTLYVSNNVPYWPKNHHYKKLVILELIIKSKID